MSEATWDRALERAAYNERTFPKVPGLGGSGVTSEMGVAGKRTSTKGTERHYPHVATSAARFGARPFSGAASDTETGTAPVANDDAYVIDFESRGVFTALSKTAQQDHLANWCSDWISGKDRSDLARTLIHTGFDRMRETDPSHFTQWRSLMSGGKKVGDLWK